MSNQIKRKMRIALYERQRHKCAYCGRYMEFKESTLDHVVPKSKGGRLTRDNRVVACAKCNTRKGNRSVGSFVCELVVNHFLGIAA